jgi:hypothetical protein
MSIAILRSAQRFILELLNLLGNCVPGGNPAKREGLFGQPYDRYGGSDGMLAVVEINIALWGMLVCSGIEVAGWFQFGF